MSLHDQLKLAGLNHSEILVYLYLLENGASSPPQVARGTAIARTNCYNVLASLQDKGLIEERARNKRKAYLANDPESLIRALEKRKEAIQQVLPDLRGLYTTQKNKPKIRFYEGIDQIKEIYAASLQSQKIIAIGSTNNIEKLMPGFLGRYFAEVKKRGIIFQDILSARSKPLAEQSKTLLKGFYEVKLLPPEHQDQPTDILIWDDNIALITLHEPIFGTILTNVLLSETFRILFELIWTREKMTSVEL